MSEVVIIHGAFHELWGPFRLWVRWTPSVLDGLWNAGVPMGSVSLPRLQDRSVVAFWGDLVRPEPHTPEELAAIAAGTVAKGTPPDGAEVVDGLELEAGGDEALADRLGRLGAGEVDVLPHP